MSQIAMQMGSHIAKLVLIDIIEDVEANGQSQKDAQSGQPDDDVEASELLVVVDNYLGFLFWVGKKRAYIPYFYLL